MMAVAKRLVTIINYLLDGITSLSLSAHINRDLMEVQFCQLTFEDCNCTVVEYCAFGSRNRSFHIRESTLNVWNSTCDLLHVFEARNTHFERAYTH